VFLHCGGLFPAPLALAQAPQPPDQMITIDISFDYFMALAAYQDLTDAEARGAAVDGEMVGVLETIISELTEIRKKYDCFEPSNGVRRDLTRRLRKLDRHISDFRTELQYRRNASELRKMLERQKALMENR
jgi:hypothetical protein